MIYKVFFLLLVTACTHVSARGVYQQPDEFIAQAFDGEPPATSVIWIKGELKQQIEKILQHKNNYRRARYWQKAQRSVWVLKEVGKTEPITVGIIIDEDKISQLKVLEFRETRGWEVRYPFFTKQFKQITLKDDNNLSATIDGISGATLSVRALHKLAQIALLLNKTVNQDATK